MNLVLIAVQAWAAATLAALAVLGVVIVLQDCLRWRTAAVHAVDRHRTAKTATALPTSTATGVPLAAAGGGAEMLPVDLSRAPDLPYGAPVIRIAAFGYLTSAFVVMVLFSALVSGASGRSWRGVRAVRK